jgi:hypothetical protein
MKTKLNLPIYPDPAATFSFSVLFFFSLDEVADETDEAIRRNLDTRREKEYF